MPTVQSLLFLTQVTSHPAIDSSRWFSTFYSKGRLGHSLSVINNGKELVACGGHDSTVRKSCISWRSGQNEWTQYETLRSHYKSDHLAYHSIFSQERYLHAAVVVQKYTIIIAGGEGSSKYTGEIVKSKFASWYMIYNGRSIGHLNFHSANDNWKWLFITGGKKLGYHPN